MDVYFTILIDLHLLGKGKLDKYSEHDSNAPVTTSNNGQIWFLQSYVC